jgi:hypothetical protein
MNTKNFNLNIIRRITTYEVENSELLLYIDELYAGEEIIKRNTGFNFKEEIDKVDNTLNTIKRTITYNNKPLTPFLITKKDLNDYLDGNIRYLTNEVMLIPDEDNYNDENNTIVLLYFADDRLYDIQFNLIPQAIVIDYINSNLTNGKYNLEDCIEALKNDERIINKELKIKDIPEYNRAENSQYIPITCRLNVENYTKFKNMEYTKRFDYVIDECLGLKEYRKGN